jgi:hypothetical protein
MMAKAMGASVEWDESVTESQGAFDQNFEFPQYPFSNFVIDLQLSYGTNCTESK